MKKSKKYSFVEFEANEILSIAIYTSDRLKKLEKKMYDKDNLENYLKKRKKIILEIEEFKKNIMEVVDE